MTDRVKGLTITLAQDIRIDDVQPLMDAIKMMRGVVDVQPSIANSDDHINRSRIKWEIRSKIMEFINEITK